MSHLSTKKTKGTVPCRQQDHVMPRDCRRTIYAPLPWQQCNLGHGPGAPGPMQQMRAAPFRAQASTIQASSPPHRPQASILQGRLNCLCHICWVGFREIPILLSGTHTLAHPFGSLSADHPSSRNQRIRCAHLLQGLGFSLDEMR